MLGAAHMVWFVLVHHPDMDVKSSDAGHLLPQACALSSLGIGASADGLKDSSIIPGSSLNESQGQP